MRLKDKIKNSDNRERAYNYLVNNRGVQPHIAAGIIGNAMQESYQLNKVWEEGKVDDVGSIGIFQWHGDRKEKLYEFRKTQDPNYKEGDFIPLEAQLDYVLYEAETGAGDNWLKKQYEKSFEADNPTQTALLFSKNVLRPHKDYAHNDKRAEYAQQIYDQYADKQIYSTDKYGNYVNVNPNTATQQQVDNSDFYKNQFYEQTYTTPENLTNYADSDENRTFATQEEVEEPAWKKKLKQKIQERNSLISLVTQGYTDYQAPEYDRSTNVAQRIAQNYMQDGGEIPISPNGLYEFPDAKQILVPVTNGRITMKNVTVPVLGISQETGQQILMQPDKEYYFPETKTVLEIPMMQEGQYNPKATDYANGGTVNRCGGHGEPPCPEKESYGIKDFVEDAYQAWFNPKNWGVTDYTDKGDFNTAYSTARKEGEKEFIYRNRRFNTLNSGTSQQQFNLYGNTDELINSNAHENNKEQILSDAINFKKGQEGDYIDRRLYINKIAGNPKYEDIIIDDWAKLMSDRMLTRSRYNSLFNTIKGVHHIAEEAHGYRNTQEGSEVLAFLKDYIKDPFITSEGQHRGYSNKEHFEFDTHSIVEPILYEYLEGTIEKEDIPLYIELLRNNKDKISTPEEALYLPYSNKSSKKDIQELQLQLHVQGYDLPNSTKKDGTFDGIWGDETKNALLEYIKSQNKLGQ